MLTEFGHYKVLFILLRVCSYYSVFVHITPCLSWSWTMPCLSILLRENSPSCPIIRALLPSRDFVGLLRINNALRMLGPDIVRILDFKFALSTSDVDAQNLIRAAICQFRHATTVILERCFMIRGIRHLGLTSLEYLHTLNLRHGSDRCVGFGGLQ